MNQWVFLNDEWAEAEQAFVSYKDLSVQRGYGIFDFFRIIGGRPVFLEDHLNRFFYSAEKMYLEVPKAKEELRKLFDELILKNSITDSGIRITLTGGYSPDGYTLTKPTLIISQQHFQPCTREQFEKGIRLMSFEHQRQLSQIKTIDYLMAIRLQPLLKKNGADDILYYKDEMITECPRANIFIVTNDDTIITPSENILKGITRKRVLEIAQGKFKLQERAISLTELKSAKEVFITSSTKEILPVFQIDEHFYKERKLSRILHQQLKQFIYTPVPLAMPS